MSECLKPEGIKNLKVYLDSIDYLKDIENVIIVPHKNVDFDAISSAIGFSLIASKMKKNPYIVVDDPAYGIDHGVQMIMNEAKKSCQIINRDKYLQIKKKQKIVIFLTRFLLISENYTFSLVKRAVYMYNKREKYIGGKHNG